MHNDIQKDMVDMYLKELAKEFKRITGRKTSAEIIIVGGGSVLLNYDFRMNSVDVDAFNTYESAIKDAAKLVADKYNLSQQWLNDDFKKTPSYSPKLRQYSSYYKTFSNVLEIRTISREYLVAMKMVSGRKYKNDLSDILGILYYHYKNNDEITYSQIEKAVEDLYGNFDRIKDDVLEFVKTAVENKTFVDGYNLQKEAEQSIKENLIKFEEKYENVLSENNIDDIINKLSE
ncbi:MAG: DUF6036 family nucleotidyltransferase [Eubacterium sp.]